MSVVAGIVLAAGTSSRFGSANKLLADWKGQPIVRVVAEAALATELEPVIVVTGHEHEKVQAALAGLDVVIVHNGDYASGQAGSVKAGISVLPDACDGAMILLADMPRVCPGDINELLDAFENDSKIVVPVFDNQRGNPVIFGRAHLGKMSNLSGDKGARELLSGDFVIRVQMDNDGVLQDFDTPDSLG